MATNGLRLWLGLSRSGGYRSTALGFGSAARPLSSGPASGQTLPPEITEENRENFRRRLLYRSQQRGWLELDLVMGEWAEKNLKSLCDERLLAYSELLDEENPDLFKWFTGQLPAPENMRKNFAFNLIHQEVQRRMKAGNAESMNRSGAEWVRGWNDRDKPSSSSSSS
ncbi:succinate dehydrogenase assembly factor [Chloropicon primus]|uniref:Succinate dehydrogenase assembly factor n=2 Tax=Chloropicon primus TaxID=1764295 RepID=A0A5B8ML44_9CHLO|nr:succinate dehydrogenase assembly factor [Chloropicon primus]UPR00333.1 succinate dehydrogenase assembly factor [Chloropicon primus]|eukprot:QDZ21119.1 succinate dehydrogenase assembly factor [Chloropicon primus]